MPQNGVFSLRIAHYRAFFVLLHKRNFFRMVPKGLNAFGSFVHAAERTPVSFLSFLGPGGRPQNGVFFLPYRT